jgi:hypothetical protein
VESNVRATDFYCHECYENLSWNTDDDGDFNNDNNNDSDTTNDDDNDIRTLATTTQSRVL